MKMEWEAGQNANGISGWKSRTAVRPGSHPVEWFIYEGMRGQFVTTYAGAVIGVSTYLISAQRDAAAAASMLGHSEVGGL